MSPINQFGVLAFASAVLAIPHVHNEHRHLHARAAPPAYASDVVKPYTNTPSAGGSYSSYPTASWNSYSAGVYGTSGWGTGTGSGFLRPTGNYPPSASTCVSPSTTTCIWRSSTSVSTIYVSPSAAPSGYPSGSAPALDDAACTPDATVTDTVTSTITVTAPAATGPGTGGKGSASSHPSSAPVGPASSSGAPAYSSNPSSAAPASQSPSAAPTSYAPAPAAPSASGSAPAYNPSSVSSSVATQPTTRAGPFSKRGLAYNDVSLTQPFLSSSQIGWGYNWVSSSGGLDSSLSYIPELHSMDSTFTDSWMSDAQAAIDAGATYLFGFNEPDISSQANLSPQAAAAGWQQYMQPFAGKAKLVAPAVSNSQTPGEGLDWLSQFMSACSGCTFDAANQHWYWSSGNDISELKSQVSAAASQTGLPVFVGEFGFVGDDSEIGSALETAMEWLDSEDSVLGYAYYMVADGLLVDGSSPSSYGETYLSS